MNCWDLRGRSATRAVDNPDTTASTRKTVGNSERLVPTARPTTRGPIELPARIPTPHTIALDNERNLGGTESDTAEMKTG
jgi:hypothetical protein